MLIPATLGIYLAGYVFVGGIDEFRRGSSLGGILCLLFVALIATLCIIGISLLIGYIKHARRNLPEGRINRLWKKSAIFNGLLLIPGIVGLASSIHDYLSHAPQSVGDVIFVVISSVVGFLTTYCWILAAIILSVSALRSNRNMRMHK